MKEFKTSSPFFSIIIPVFNASGTLNRCLDSVLCQSFQDFEIICIDDGSTDSSWSILDQYVLKDARIKRFSQLNAGPSVARNKGLDESSGEYVLFVDADDYYFVDSALSVLYDTIIKNGDCDLVYFAGVLASSDGSFIDDTKTSRVYEYGYQCMEDNCLNSAGIIFGSSNVQCCKRSFIEENGIRFDSRLMYGEDRLFVCTLFHFAKKTVEIADALYCYDISNNSSLMHDEKRKIRWCSDNQRLAYQIDRLLQDRRFKRPHLRKYLHGLYMQSLNRNGITRKEIDWRLLFRNASTFKLLVKDILLFLGFIHY